MEKGSHPHLLISDRMTDGRRIRFRYPLTEKERGMDPVEIAEVEKIALEVFRCPEETEFWEVLGVALSAF